MKNRAIYSRSPFHLRRWFRPEEALLLAYGAALACFIPIIGWRNLTAFDHPRFLQCCSVLMLLVFARAYRHARRSTGADEAFSLALRAAGAVIRDFLPFFGGLLIYEALHDLTPILRPDVVDPALIAIDRFLFHVDVAYWMGQYASPFLTRVMVQCYLSYFVAPGLLACLLYWRGERVLFREYLVSLCVVTLLGYAGYLLVPAVGPYVFQSSLFPTRLPGGEQTHFLLSEVDKLKGVARDCFPSMHTAHTTVVLVFAWRYRRWLGLAYLPIAIGLYFSTLYLRMHYVVDVFAGFAVSAAAVTLGPRLERWWQGGADAALVVEPKSTV
jgi:membrane-associated phospholipid phosphatase